MKRFLVWLSELFWNDDEELTGVDDPHDPQYVTRIYGGGFEKGEWTWND